MDEALADQGVFVAQVPMHHVFTVYSLIGDGFGWLPVGGFVVLIVLASLKRRKG